MTCEMPLDRARFETRVDRSGFHHTWLGARSPGGRGQVRIDAKLLTTARAAWEIENGPVPDGVRVRSCADEPACVRVDHLRLDQQAMSSKSPPSKKRSPRGARTITAISPGVWKIGVTALSLIAAEEFDHRTPSIATIVVDEIEAGLATLDAGGSIAQQLSVARPFNAMRRPSSNTCAVPDS